MVVRGGGRDGGWRGREGWWREGEGGMVVGGNGAYMYICIVYVEERERRGVTFSVHLLLLSLLNSRQRVCHD